MHVLIDTNIFLEDLLLGKAEFGALETYLRRTSSTLLVPDVINAELKKHIQKRAVEDYNSIRNSYATKLGLISKEIDSSQIGEKLQEYFDNRLAKIERKFLTHGHIQVEDLLKRSLEETPPFQASDKGLRDSMIWLSLINFLIKSPNETVALITKNSKDFGKVQLKEELLGELRGCGAENRFVYFNSLGDFLTEYERPISYINDAFINNSISEYVKDEAANITSDDIEFDISHSDIRYEIEDVEYSHYEVDRYYVYRSTPENYTIYVEVSTIHNASVQYGEAVYQYNLISNDYEAQWMDEIEYVTGYAFVELFVTVNKHTKQVTKVASHHND